MTNPPPPGTSPYAGESQTAPAAGNPLGRVALIVAIVAVVVGLIQQVFGSFLPVIAYDLALPTSAVSVVLGILTFIRLIAGAAALIIGLVAMSRRHLPQLGAGIAIGVGGYAVISAVLGLLVGPIFSLIY